MTLWNAEGLKPIGYLVWPLRSLKVRNPFWLWPDLVTWPLVTWGWNFYTRCQIQLWAGTEKMAALRAAVFPLSAKNRRGGHFLPPPPSSARVNLHNLGLSTCRTYSHQYTCCERQRMHSISIYECVRPNVDNGFDMSIIRYVRVSIIGHKT